MFMCGKRMKGEVEEVRQVSGRLEGGVSDAGPGRWSRTTNQFPFTVIQVFNGKGAPVSVMVDFIIHTESLKE